MTFGGPLVKPTAKVTRSVYQQGESSSVISWKENKSALRYFTAEVSPVWW